VFDHPTSTAFRPKAASAFGLPRAARRRRGLGARLMIVTAGLAAAFIASAGWAAEPRCSLALQKNVCLEATGTCPAAPPTVGLAAGSWPVFQQNAQHTGVTTQHGPACGNVAWTRKLAGKIFSAAALAEPAPGQPEILFVPAAKYPVCGLDPQTGAVLWCGTDDQGRLVDRSSPVIGNGTSLYVGTRDNDLWAIDLPSGSGEAGTVAWRQKICTDGDVTMPPAIGQDGMIYMGSDSLGAGTIMAMCPGPTREVRWCHNPMGGGFRNASPALNAAGDRLYVTVGRTTLIAYQPQTGDELWRIDLEPRRGGVGRTANYSPVVDPITGRVYVGLSKGLWAVDTVIDPETSRETPVATLLFATGPTRERLTAPPVLDRARNRILFGATRGSKPTLYAISLDGSLLWKRSDLPRGRFENNPPVVDGNGRIYLTLRKAILGLAPNGNPLWQVNSPTATFVASPIVANGMLYVGSTNSTVYAVGGCP
jgi:outer membrane protein assembly factor BamB